MRIGDDLFHGMPTQPTGEAIRPGTKYGTGISEEARKALGIPPGAAAPPLVFATPFLQHAVCFTTAVREAAPLVFMPYDLARGAYLGIYGNRDHLMQAALDGVVFAFSGKGFVPLEGRPDHFISTNPVPFGATRRAAEVKSMADVMRLGVQVFSIPDVPPKTPQDPPLPRLPIATARDIAPLIASGRVVWENESRGINPDPQLREILRGAS